MLAGMGAPGYLAPWVRLSSEWTRATVVDLPGWSRGGARSCAPTVADLTTALAHWLEVRDLRDVVLLGHSIGSQTVLQTALMVQERLRGVVLAGPSFPPDIRRGGALTRRIFTTIPKEPADEIEAIAPSFLSSGGPACSGCSTTGWANARRTTSAGSTSRSWSWPGSTTGWHRPRGPGTCRGSRAMALSSSFPGPTTPASHTSERPTRPFGRPSSDGRSDPGRWLTSGRPG